MWVSRDRHQVGAALGWRCAYDHRVRSVYPIDPTRCGCDTLINILFCREWRARRLGPARRSPGRPGGRFPSRICVDALGVGWGVGVWLARGPLSAGRGSCPGCSRRWLSGPGWCLWWGMPVSPRPGLWPRLWPGPPWVGWSRSGVGVCRWPRSCHCCRSPNPLGQLSRLGGGAPFEAVLEGAPAYGRPEVARLLPKLDSGA
jgi:hypothetical protein